MKTIYEVFEEAKKLQREIKRVVRMSTYNQNCCSLDELEMDHSDPEQMLLADALFEAMAQLDDAQKTIAYLANSIKETSTLHKNEIGKYETAEGHMYSCGSSIEALVTDEYRDNPYWAISSVEHNGNSYYIVDHSNVLMNGLTVRVRDVE